MHIDIVSKVSHLYRVTRVHSVTLVVSHLYSLTFVNRATLVQHYFKIEYYTICVAIFYAKLS